MMKDLMDVILTRHSVREFTGEEIRREALETILKAGMAAPSAVNVQPWAFVVVTDKKILSRLCEKLPYAKMLDKAGAAIIVCGVPDKDRQFAPKHWVCDCSAATENILLAAHALHLGAVWTAVYPERDRMDCVRKECHIPEAIIPLNVIPIGVPKNRDSKPIDKYRTENIHWNKW